jgi:hypothetical protein
LGVLWLCKHVKVCFFLEITLFVMILYTTTDGAASQSSYQLWLACWGRECVKNLSTLTGLLGKRVCEKAINSDWLVEGRECVKKLSTLTGLLGKSVWKSYQLWLACWGREFVKWLSTLTGLLGKRVCEIAITSDWLVGEESV